MAAMFQIVASLRSGSFPMEVLNNVSSRRINSSRISPICLLPIIAMILVRSASSWSVSCSVI
jgi:hypothetical protein